MPRAAKPAAKPALTPFERVALDFVAAVQQSPNRDQIAAIFAGTSAQPVKPAPVQAVVDTHLDDGNVLTVRGPTVDGGWWVHSTRDEGPLRYSHTYRSPEAASRVMRGGDVDECDVLRWG